MKSQRVVLPESLSGAWYKAVDRITQGILRRADVSGAPLASAVKDLSLIYTRRDDASGTTVQLKDTNHAAALSARARFFFLRDLPKVRGPLTELHAANALPKERVWRVLDVGAGLGAMSFGLAGFARAHNLCDRIDVDAVDYDKQALAWASAFAAETQPGASLAEETVPTSITARTLNLTHARSLAALGTFDFILFGFTLNELYQDVTPDESVQKRAQLLSSCLELLSMNGSLLVLEPALRRTSRELHRVRDLIAREKAFTVFAPCLREGDCPMLLTERDWCHESLPLALPDGAHQIARDAGLRFEGLSYSYLTLRRDHTRLRDVMPTDRTRVHLRVVSDLLTSKGKIEVYLCGDEGRLRATRLDRERSDTNTALGDLARGSLISLEHATFTSLHEAVAKVKVAETTVVSPRSLEKAGPKSKSAL